MPGLLIAAFVVAVIAGAIIKPRKIALVVAAYLSIVLWFFSGCMVFHDLLPRI